MVEIPLRAYIRDIDSMIDRGDLEEAIIHCRYILTEYPKHIDTYRLLGKAFLEGQRYSDAADVFQRVLSSVPDDYISHIGMSLIREDEANIEAAIYHMDRAAEVQPANQAIQAEQRRLYGRRDRVEPSRVGLTRGALARMYYAGELYSQAITELRTALAEEPQRSDLRLLLANTYYKSGREVDAADACSSILSKLPYCLEANLLLAKILATSKRADESTLYYQRVYELDPYAEYIDKNNSSPTSVPENSVMIERLADEAKQDQEMSQADWMTSIGLHKDDLTQEQSQLPEWLVDEPMEKPTNTAEAEPSQNHIPPFTFPDDDEVIEQQLSEPAAVQGDDSVEISAVVAELDKNPDQDDLLPDWLKDAGWQSAGNGEDTKAYEDTSNLDLSTSPEISEADIPEWLQALAPPEEIGASQDTESQPTTGELDEAAARSWLEESPSSTHEGDIGWLGIDSKIGSDLDITAGQDEIEAPDWLKNLTPSSDMAKEDIPDWLEDLESAISTEDAVPVIEENSEDHEMIGPDDSSDVKEMVDESTTESTIDDAVVITTAGIMAAKQLSHLDPDESQETSLQADKDSKSTFQDGDLQVSAQDALEYPPREISVQPEEEVSEQPFSTQEVVDEPTLIISGEILPMEEDQAGFESTGTESVPAASIPADVPTSELLDQTSDDLLQTAPEEPEHDSAGFVSSFSDSSIDSPDVYAKQDELEKPELRDTEPYTWVDESSFHVPDSDGSQIDREESVELKASQPELHSAVDEEVVMNKNDMTDKSDTGDGQEDLEAAIIPDWLDEFDSVPIREAPIENEPEEIPDWLRSLAPQEGESASIGGGVSTEEANKIEPLSTESIGIEPDELPESITGEDLLPDWLSAESPEYSPAKIASEPIIDWLDSIGDEDSALISDDIDAIKTAGGQVPTFDIEEPPIQADDTQPSVLSAPKEPAESKMEPEIAAPDTNIVEDISDQIEEFPITADLDVDEETDVIPDWLSEIASVSPQEEIEGDESTPDIPDWLLDVADQSEGPGDMAAAEIAAPQIESQQAAGTEDSIPDWVQELAPSEPGVIDDTFQIIEPSDEFDETKELQPVDEEESESLIEELQELDSIKEVHAEEQPPSDMADSADTELSLPITEADTEELTEPSPEEELEIQAVPGLMVIETATLNATITTGEQAEIGPEDEVGTDESSEPAEMSLPPSELITTQAGEIDTEDLEEMEDTSDVAAEIEPALPDWLTGIEESALGEEESVWQPSQLPTAQKQELEISDAESPPETRVEEISADIDDIEDEFQISLVQARNALVQGDQADAVNQYNNLIESKQFLPEVINDLQGALTQSPTDMTLWQTLGDAYANADRLQDALDAYTKAEQLLG